jgi:hypothetical protein
VNHNSFLKCLALPKWTPYSGFRTPNPTHVCDHFAKTTAILHPEILIRVVCLPSTNWDHCYIVWRCRKSWTLSYHRREVESRLVFRLMSSQIWNEQTVCNILPSNTKFETRIICPGLVLNSTRLQSTPSCEEIREGPWIPSREPQRLGPSMPYIGVLINERALPHMWLHHHLNLGVPHSVSLQIFYFFLIAIVSTHYKAAVNARRSVKMLPRRNSSSCHCKFTLVITCLQSVYLMYSNNCMQNYSCIVVWRHLIHTQMLQTLPLHASSYSWS